MKKHVVLLKSECNKKKLSEHISNFCNLTIFKKRYVKVILNLYLVNKEIVQLGDLYIFDRNSKKDIDLYKFYLVTNFLNIFLVNHNERIKNLVFDYSETTKKEYLEFISKTLSEK